MVSFAEVFIEIYNACAASIIIFLIGQIVFMMHRVDRGLFKAKLFLNDAVLQKTWIYISISGAAFALNSVIKFIIRFTSAGEVFKSYYLVELTQIIFIIAFIHAVYNWYLFMAGFVSK